MRTTLSIDDDAFRLVQQYAEARSLALGKAVSELVRRGATHRWGMREVDGVHVVDLPSDSPRVTTKQVLALEDEL